MQAAFYYLSSFLSLWVSWTNYHHSAVSCHSPFFFLQPCNAVWRMKVANNAQRWPVTHVGAWGSLHLHADFLENGSASHFIMGISVTWLFHFCLKNFLSFWYVQGYTNTRVLITLYYRFICITLRDSSLFEQEGCIYF